MLTAILLLTSLAAETHSVVATDGRSLPVKKAAAFTRYISACEIVTRADVEKALAREVNRGTEENDGPASTCDYAMKGGLISITIQRLAAKPDLSVEVAAMQKKIGQGTVRHAAEFDEAFYFDIPSAGTQLHLIDGSSTHLMVSVLGMGEGPQVSDVAAQLAKKALAKLLKR